MFKAATLTRTGPFHFLELVSCSRRRRRSNRNAWRSGLFLRTHESLQKVEKDRDEEAGNKAGGEHAADNDKPHDLARKGAGAARAGQGHTSENESERRHEDW